MEKLTQLDMELILRVVAHYMTHEIRGKVMEQLPQAYNRWMGAEIMEARIKPDGRVSVARDGS